MSYDLDHVEKRCSCPCGQGEIVYGWGTNDWNQIKEGMMEIRCPECGKLYKFAKEGLLPKDYPEYNGDKTLKSKIDYLKHIIDNYGYRLWPDELRKERIQLCLTPKEIEDDKEKNEHRYFLMIFDYSKKIYKNHTIEELKNIYEQMREAKYSTRLTGIAKQLAKTHKRHYGTIKLDNVMYPIWVAIRNYENYTRIDKEDELYISELKKKVEEYEKEYYKDFPVYEEKRLKHIIHYELKEI